MITKMRRQAIRRRANFGVPTFWLGFGNVLNLGVGISPNLPANYQGETDLEAVVNDSVSLEEDFDRVANDYARALENIVNQQTN